MEMLAVSIVRFADERQPGFVECVLTDAFGIRHLFVEKVPVVTLENLSSDSSYPTSGVIACEIEARWQAPDGRSLVRINTERPWGIESVEGRSDFVVLASQIQHDTR